MNVADGTVISQTHRKHRAAEFKAFPAQVDKTAPKHLDVNVVADNYSAHNAPVVQRWLAAHPRFHMYFSPTYSS